MADPQQAERARGEVEPRSTGGRAEALPAPDARGTLDPGEDPGTLTDEEYFAGGGPDAIDAAADHRRRER